MQEKSQCILRKAELSDLERINEIYNWAVMNTVATFDLNERSREGAQSWFNVHLDPYYPIFVVESRQKIVGWGSLSPFHTRPAYRQSGEFSIYVAPEYHGQGIGDTLLKKCCEEAELLGYHTLLGLITATNIASLSLAEKYGFTEAGRFREVGKKFGKNLDVVVMQKMLN
jgi:phosphinothricin acetyltransferase